MSRPSSSTRCAWAGGGRCGSCSWTARSTRPCPPWRASPRASVRGGPQPRPSGAPSSPPRHLRPLRPIRRAPSPPTRGGDSGLRLHPIAWGGGLARHDVHTVLAGSGAELILNGFYLLHGSQHSDHHTVIDHAQPHCASHEFFNGIVGEQGHGVFNGRIIVRPGAQRTDSKQTNNNLLLSTAARADSQPQLEIYADDVKCTHGSPVRPRPTKRRASGSRDS